MATITFISPKNLFSKIADMFHIREGFAPSDKFQPRTTNPENMPTSRAHQDQPNKNKLNISLDDLKLISTALLQYRRNLAKIGEIEKAEGVARIDQQFYDLINEIEAKA